jgi:uridine kinase
MVQIDRTNTASVGLDLYTVAERHQDIASRNQYRYDCYSCNNWPHPFLDDIVPADQ